MYGAYVDEFVWSLDISHDEIRINLTHYLTLGFVNFLTALCVKLN